MKLARMFWTSLSVFTLAAAVSASLAADQAIPNATLSSAYNTVTPNTLARAVQAVEQATGGRVLEVRLLHQNGPGFQAVVIKNKQLTNVKVNSSNGNVTTIAATETPQWMLDWRLKSEAHEIGHAHVTPQQAVRSVEQAAGAPAIDVALARPLSGGNDVLAYNVEVVKDGMPQRVAIDANTGQIIADPQTVLGPWTPERLAEQDQSQNR
jgi:uncharacterized membrane protein YkoI